MNVLFVIDIFFIYYINHLWFPYHENNIKKIHLITNRSRSTRNDESSYSQQTRNENHKPDRTGTEFPNQTSKLTQTKIQETSWSPKAQSRSRKSRKGSAIRQRWALSTTARGWLVERRQNTDEDACAEVGQFRRFCRCLLKVWWKNSEKKEENLQPSSAT